MPLVQVPCHIVLENADDILMENGDILVKEGFATQYFMLEDASGFVLQEDGGYLLKEEVSCYHDTGAAGAVVLRLGKRRAVGHHSRGVREPAIS